MSVKYQVTKEECQKSIEGVCEGCGGELKPMKTVNNANEPTYWVGCLHCSCFRSGVSREYWEIARQLVEKEKIIPYFRMHRSEYEDTPEKLEYYYDSQCAGLSHTIAYIHKLLKQKFVNKKKESS